MRYIYINRTNKKSILGLCMSLIWLCMIITPIIDNFVGYLMNTSGEETSISKIFRMLFILVLLLAMISALEKKDSIWIGSLLLYIMILPILYSVLNDFSKSIITDTLYLFKLFFPIMYIVAAMALNEKGYPVKSINLHLLRYFSVIYPISVIIPMLLDGGYKSYGSIGIRGLFSSGNEISIVLGVMFIVNYAFMRKRIKAFNVIMTIISAIVGILTASKAIIIIYVLFGLFIVLKKKNAKIQNIVIIATMFGFLIFVMNKFFYNEIIIFIERMQFRYEQLGNSFWNVLFSNRNLKILPNLENNYFSFKGVFYFLFGRGSFYHIYTTRYSQYIAASGLVEMDFFDLLLQNGLIIFVIVVSFYYKVFKRKVKDEMYSMIKFSCFVMLLFSFMAGHVLYNPLSSTVLALLCSLLVVYK